MTATLRPAAESSRIFLASPAHRVAVSCARRRLVLLRAGARCALLVAPFVAMISCEGTRGHAECGGTGRKNPSDPRAPRGPRAPRAFSTRHHAGPLRPARELPMTSAGV